MKQRILILGASSYIGAGLQEKLSNCFDVQGTYAGNKIFENQLQLDITDKAASSKLIRNLNPDIILHCANNANSRWCESNPNQASKLNVESTLHLAEIADSLGSKWIYISSFAAMHPSSGFYAKSKLESEKISMLIKDWLIIRPSFTLGLSPNTTNDRPFNRLLKNITDNTPAIYDNTWKFLPTYLGHLNAVIKECILKDIRKEIVPVACPEPATRFKIASDILSAFNKIASVSNEADNSPAHICELRALKELNLPEISHTNLTTAIIEEIEGYLAL